MLFGYGSTLLSMIVVRCRENSLHRDLKMISFETNHILVAGRIFILEMITTAMGYLYN